MSLTADAALTVDSQKDEGRFIALSAKITVAPDPEPDWTETTRACDAAYRRFITERLLCTPELV